MLFKKRPRFFQGHAAYCRRWVKKLKHDRPQLRKVRFFHVNCKVRPKMYQVSRDYGFGAVLFIFAKSYFLETTYDVSFYESLLFDFFLSPCDRLQVNSL